MVISISELVQVQSIRREKTQCISSFLFYLCCCATKKGQSQSRIEFVSNSHVNESRSICLLFNYSMSSFQASFCVIIFRFMSLFSSLAAPCFCAD